MPGDWFTEDGAGEKLDVLAVLDPGALDAVVAVVATGALVSLGMSGDGGALSLTVTSDGRWRREWFRDGEAIRQWLAGAAEFLRNGGGRSTPTGSRRRAASR